jgi:hypothetical protein
MRHLFVPACVCLMTWSGATGTDSKFSLDSFSGAKADKEVAAPTEPTGANAPDTGSAAAAHANISIDVSPAELALETPKTETADLLPATLAEPEVIPLPPVPKPVVHRTHQEVCDTLAQAAVKNDLPVPFFISLLFQESRFQPGVVSSAGAQGVAQFMPATAASMGLENPFDPLQAIPASARLLRELIGQFGNLGLAAAAYNAGPKRIQDWLQKKGKLPEETQGYVKTITGHAAENWTAATAAHPGQRLPRRAPCQEEAGLYAYAAAPDTIPMPQPSPLTHQGPVATTARLRIVAAPSSQRIRLASATSPIQISKQGSRVTAVIDVAKAVTKNVAANVTKTVAATVATVAAKTVTKPATKSGTTTVAKSDAKIISMAVKDIIKPEKTAKAASTADKPVSQQLAARKQKADKPKFAKVAQR